MDLLLGGVGPLGDAAVGECEASPTHKMVQDIMAREALGADEPKRLEAGE